ncbi:hypothetical protein ACHWQZ_G009553 [Mnemiopsis leidyi]
MRCIVLLLAALTVINAEEGQLETLVGEQKSDSGDRVIGVVDSKGRLRIGHVTPSDQDIKWRTVAKDIIDLEISASGVLWAVNTKSIYHMIPFTDIALTRLQVAPHSEKAEGFKVITVDQYNNIWTVSTANTFHSNRTGMWEEESLNAVSKGKCDNANDLSVTSTGDVWVICDSQLGRITGGKEWDLTYNGKGGSHVAAVGTNYVVYTTTIDNSDRMIKSMFESGGKPEARPDSSDVCFYDGSIWKLSKDGSKIVEYRDDENNRLRKMREFELSKFNATRMSVGGYRRPEEQPTSPTISFNPGNRGEGTVPNIRTRIAD